MLQISNADTPSVNQNKLDSLLKMFNSEYFTEEMLFQYYHKNLNNTGVHDYLSNKLYSLSLEQVSNNVSVLCYMLIKHESLQLEKFIIDRSGAHFSLFLKMYWCVHAYSATDRLIPKKAQRIDKIERCMEMAMVNQNMAKGDLQNELLLKHFETKQHRSNYFNFVCRFMNKMTRFSLTLQQFPREDRKHHLRQFIMKINRTLESQRELLPPEPCFHGISLPIEQFGDQNSNSLMIVQIVQSNFLCFHTRKRVPYQILVETIDQSDLLKYQPLPQPSAQYSEIEDDDAQSDDKLEKQVQQMAKDQQQSYHDALEKIMKLEHKGKRQSVIMKEINKMVKDYKFEEEKDQKLQKQESMPQKIKGPQLRRQVKSCVDLQQQVLEQRASRSQDRVQFSFAKQEQFLLQQINDYPQKEYILRQKLLQLYLQWHKTQEQSTELWQESWEDICGRIRQQSIYGHFPSYKLRPIIIKGGDDLRQELMVIKVMEKFSKIFDAARLNLYLRPYNITVTSSTSGIVEFIPNTMSIDSLKKEFGQGTKTLFQVYTEIFGRSFVEAQKNFIESLAGYSLFSYLMNIKDRHNGNLLIDSVGHIIHIDFGFALASSPGSVNFESAPFKLTQEYVEVMKGKNSDYYGYFRTLMIRGLLELKKHVNDIQYMLQIMNEESDLPCFYNFDIKVWRARFMEGATDEECIQNIDKIIYKSLYSWRTAQYDNFQKKTNGILP